MFELAQMSFGYFEEDHLFENVTYLCKQQKIGLIVPTLVGRAEIYIAVLRTKGIKNIL